MSATTSGSALVTRVVAGIGPVSIMIGSAPDTAPLR